MPYISKIIAEKRGIKSGSIHTILFNKHIYSKTEAKAWLKHHKYKSNDIRETENMYRFMQHNPINSAHFATREIAPGIELILQYF